MNATPLDKVKKALGGRCKRSGKGYSAVCPAHNDSHPSLTITECKDGKVLLRCHAGCSAESIVEALGLTMKDLFPDGGEKAPRNAKKERATDAEAQRIFGSAREAIEELEKRYGKRSAYWTYTDPSGERIAAVVRWDNVDGKTFRPVARVGSVWHIGDPDGPWPLYQLPEILKSRDRVFVCEGEKAADAVRSLVLTATTSAHGALAAKKTDWTALAGREVVILPDHDEAGACYAQDVAAILAALTPTVKIVKLPNLPDHGDAVEYVMACTGEGLDKEAIRARMNALADRANTVTAEKAEPWPAPILISLADVEPQPIEWLWPERIALGKLTLIAGDPGVGKSLLTLDIAARLSHGGPWPDKPSDMNRIGSVVLLSAEDDPADTLRPRLEAAGANLKRIHVLNGVKREHRGGAGGLGLFCLESDLPMLAEAIRSVPDCRLVLIDPITAYTGRIDSHNNTEVRGLLAPLAALAAEHNVAVIAVTHFNKSGTGPAIYRAMGSLAFAAAARAVWAVIKDPDNPQRRLFLPVKNNLGGDMSGLAYTIEADGPDGAPVVAWEPDRLIAFRKRAIFAV